MAALAAKSASHPSCRSRIGVGGNPEMDAYVILIAAERVGAHSRPRSLTVGDTSL
jgi:hypothetical protein